MEKFPFEDEVYGRNKGFTELFLGMILYEQVHGLANLYSSCKEGYFAVHPEKEDGEVTLSGLSYCVEGVDRYYSPIHLRKLFESIELSILDIFNADPFKSVAKNFPDLKDDFSQVLFSAEDCLWARDSLAHLFYSFYEKLDELKYLFDRFNNDFLQIFSGAFRPGLQKGKKGAEVGAVHFGSTASELSRPLDSGLAYPLKVAYRRDQIRRCYDLVNAYIEEANSFHDYVFAHASDIEQGLSEICAKFEFQERKLFHLLSKKGPIAYYIIKKHYEHELQELSSAKKDNPYWRGNSFDQMNAEVEEVRKIYQHTRRRAA